MPPDDRQLAFEDLETAVAEAEAAREAMTERNADDKPRRSAAKRNLGHLPDHLPRIWVMLARGEDYRDPVIASAA